MKHNVNLTASVTARLQAALVPDETAYHFLASAAMREIKRRERGGAVVVVERKAGRPNKSSSKDETK